MPLSEESIRFLEEHIPELAEAAVKQAYWQALASGSSVVESIDGLLVETFPDGTQRIIKSLEPDTPVTPGETFVVDRHE
jgi:hypothetical protein